MVGVMGDRAAARCKYLLDAWDLKIVHEKDQRPIIFMVWVET